MNRPRGSAREYVPPAGEAVSGALHRGLKERHIQMIAIGRATTSPVLRRSAGSLSGG